MSSTPSALAAAPMSSSRLHSRRSVCSSGSHPQQADCLGPRTPAQRDRPTAMNSTNPTSYQPRATSCAPPQNSMNSTSHKLRATCPTALRPSAATGYHPANTGALAQLGERLHGMQEARGSSPLGSTTPHKQHHTLPALSKVMNSVIPGCRRLRVRELHSRAQSGPHAATLACRTRHPRLSFHYGRRASGQPHAPSD